MEERRLVFVGGQREIETESEREGRGRLACGA